MAGVQEAGVTRLVEVELELGTGRTSGGPSSTRSSAPPSSIPEDRPRWSEQSPGNEPQDLTAPRLALGLDMTIGKVSHYNPARGFGFLETSESPDDIFFHVSDIPGAVEPREGTEMEFTIVPAERGPRADDIQILG